MSAPGSCIACSCRYYAPDRDLELVHKINPHPMSWAEFLKQSKFDGSQDVDYLRAKFV